MRRIQPTVAFALVFVWLLSMGAFPQSTAQELPTAKPEEAGLSAEKLARIGPAVKALIDDHKVAGAITMIARQGKVVYFEALGLRDVESGKPMERDTIFRIYSMTKPITSVAVMMLVEEGKIGLDDPVSKHLGELKGLKVFLKAGESGVETEASKREPAVRDLLRHTAGLTYGLFGSTAVDQMYQKADLFSSGSTLADMTKKLAQIPLLYQPGTKWVYSVSTDVLGRIVEVASGKTFAEFLEERVFRPLDMKDSGFFVPAEKLDRFAATHAPKPDGGLRVSDSPATSKFRNRPTLLSGGGGMVSTARDYMRFCQMLANGGELNGKRLLRKETLHEMTRDQLPSEAFPISFGPIQRSGVGFGLGFSVQVSPDTGRAGEYGWGGAASTHFWISPKDDLIVIALQQFMPFTPQLEQTIKPLVYEAVLK